MVDKMLERDLQITHSLDCMPARPGRADAYRYRSQAFLLAKGRE
jgi:hypothetical protein